MFHFRPPLGLSEFVRINCIGIKREFGEMQMSANWNSKVANVWKELDSNRTFVFLAHDALPLQVLHQIIGCWRTRLGTCRWSSHILFFLPLDPLSCWTSCIVDPYILFFSHCWSSYILFFSHVVLLTFDHLAGEDEVVVQENVRHRTCASDRLHQHGHGWSGSKIVATPTADVTKTVQIEFKLQQLNCWIQVAV